MRVRTLLLTDPGAGFQELDKRHFESPVLVYLVYLSHHAQVEGQLHVLFREVPVV